MENDTSKDGEEEYDVKSEKDSSGTADSFDQADSDNVTNDGKANEGLSKRQQKRIKKHERWLELKMQRRKEEKLKKKRKFAEARKRGDLGPSRKALKKNSIVNSSCKVKVVLDCSFDDYMSEKDVRHLVQQIQHSYSCNRRADNPLQYYVCGLNGKTQRRLEQIGDYKGWDVYMKTEGYLETFPKDSIVYLSSDSPTVLQELEDDKVYVIGGLVDHNHHKGLCHRLAEEKGVSHAQLPISEYIDMKTRKVLTVNHVFEILLRYTESHDWRKAFFQVLPQRKGLKVKDDSEEGQEEGTEECVAQSSDNGTDNTTASEKGLSGTGECNTKTIDIGDTEPAHMSEQAAEPNLVKSEAVIIERETTLATSTNQSMQQNGDET